MDHEYQLKKFLRSPFPTKILPLLLVVFAVLGFFDASYLSILHFKNLIPPCTIGGCETVLTSTFATFFGIPIALVGSGFYLLLIILGGLFLTIRQRRYEIGLLLFILCSLGLLVGIGLIIIQAFLLHAWCYYCLFSELIDFLLFDASWWLYASVKK